MPTGQFMQDALDAITAILTTHYATGDDKIASRYSVPPEAVADYPFSVTFARSGESEIKPAGTIRDLDTLVLQIHVGRIAELNEEIVKLMKYSDDVQMLLWNSHTLGGTIDTIRAIRYTFGPLNWGGQQLTIGWEFEIDVKRISTLLSTPQQ